jgi:hypothetical protein
LAGGGRAALGDGTVVGGEGDQVHPVQFVAGVAPCVVGGGLGDLDQEQGEPAELDVVADAILAAVVDRAQPEGGLHVPPAGFDRDQLLVGRSQVLGGEGGVAGAEQPSAATNGTWCIPKWPIVGIGVAGHYLRLTRGDGWRSSSEPVRPGSGRRPGRSPAPANPWSWPGLPDG